MIGRCSHTSAFVYSARGGVMSWEVLLPVALVAVFVLACLVYCCCCKRHCCSDDHDAATEAECGGCCARTYHVRQVAQESFSFSFTRGVSARRMIFLSRVGCGLVGYCWLCLGWLWIVNPQLCISAPPSCGSLFLLANG